MGNDVHKTTHTFIFFLILGLATAARADVDCQALSDSASKIGVYIPGDDSGRQVIGSGRLQFYSAPNSACKVRGVFILPNETVDAYTEYNNFTSVIYINVKTKTKATGWVESSRLKPTGLGIAPHQP